MRLDYVWKEKVANEENDEIVKKDKNSSTSKKPISVKTPSANAKGTKSLGNAKGTTKARRRLSYPAATEKSSA